MSDDAVSATPQSGTPTAPRPQRNWGAPVVALVIGLVVGTGGATLVWTLTRSGGDVGDGAEGDVSIACQLIELKSTESTTARAFIEDSSRWSAARSLVANAAQKNSRYRQLDEALTDSVEGAYANYSTNAPEFEKPAQQARQICREL